MAIQLATISDLGLNATAATGQDVSTTNFPVLDVRNYGVKGDGTQLTTCTGNAGSPNVACTGSPFTAADIGKMATFSERRPQALSLEHHRRWLLTHPRTFPPRTVRSPPFPQHSTSLFFYGTDNTSAWCNMMNCNSANPAPMASTRPSPAGPHLRASRHLLLQQYRFTAATATIVGADQSSTECSSSIAIPYQEFLYLGAYNNAGSTWTLDAGGTQ